LEKAALAAFFISGIAGFCLSDYASELFVKIVTEIY